MAHIGLVRDIFDPPIDPTIKVGVGQGQALTDLRLARPEHLFGLEGAKSILNAAKGGSGGGTSPSGTTPTPPSLVTKAADDTTNPTKTAFANDL